MAATPVAAAAAAAAAAAREAAPTVNAPVTAAAVEAEAAVELAEAAGEARSEATAEAGATGKAGPEAKSGKVAKQRVEPERTKAAEEALRKLLFAPKLTDLEMMRGAISEGEIAEVQPELLAEATGMHPLLSASSLHPLSTSPPLHRSTAPSSCLAFAHFSVPSPSSLCTLMHTHLRPPRPQPEAIVAKGGTRCAPRLFTACPPALPPQAN